MARGVLPLRAPVEFGVRRAGAAVENLMYAWIMFGLSWMLGLAIGEAVHETSPAGEVWLMTFGGIWMTLCIALRDWIRYVLAD